MLPQQLFSRSLSLVSPAGNDVYAVWRIAIIIVCVCVRVYCRMMANANKTKDASKLREKYANATLRVSRCCCCFVVLGVDSVSENAWATANGDMMKIDKLHIRLARPYFIACEIKRRPRARVNRMPSTICTCGGRYEIERNTRAKNGPEQSHIFKQSNTAANTQSHTNRDQTQGRKNSVLCLCLH